MSRIVSVYDPGHEIREQEALALHRNENLFVGPDWTLEAATKAVAEAAIASYPNPSADPVRQAIADLYGVDFENVFVGNGADEVLAYLLASLRHSHDRLGIQDVCFKVYDQLAERFGFRLERLPGDTFRTGRIASEGWRGLALADSPNAITGVSIGREELFRLAGDERSFLIWDNVYGEYAGESLPLPIRNNVAFVRSFSKFYALAGLRIGYAIADRGVIRQLLDHKDAFNVNSFAQVMALEALGRRGHFEALLEEALRCRRELIAGLRRLGFCVHESKGISVLAAHPDFTGESLQSGLLERKVVVRRFRDELTRNHIRVTVAPPETMGRFFCALTAVLEAGKQGGQAEA